MATSAQPHPLDGVDDLGEAVLQGLARPIGYKQSPQPVRTFLVGLISFGFAPILRWQTMFRQYATLEQQQLWHLADWVRRSGRAKEGEELIHAANDVQRSTPIPLLIIICLGYVGWTFYHVLTHIHGAPIHWLLATTYRYPLRHNWEVLADPRAVFSAWTLGLAAAYLLHTTQLYMHAARVNRFLGAFNRLAQSSRLPPVPTTPIGIPCCGPLLIAGAIGFVYLNAPWGVLMMFAAAVQRRLIRRTSTLQRRELAMRLQSLLLAGRPNADLVTPVNLRALCPNELCRATLKQGSRFCPRCGRPLSTVA